MVPVIAICPAGIKRENIPCKGCVKMVFSCLKYDVLVIPTTPALHSGYSVRSGGGRPGFDPRPHHTKDVKTGRFALLSLALGIIDLGKRMHH